MYGWEFPPHTQGGLGVACEGIVKGLLRHGVNVNLVLPSADPAAHTSKEKLRIIGTSNNFQQIKISSGLSPYQGAQEYVVNSVGKKMSVYGSSLWEEVQRYAEKAGVLAQNINHDVIHAHDWMTYPAASMAKKHSNKAFIAHIHATEFDRSGDNPDPLIVELERLGFEAADKIIAVSAFTKEKIVKHYSIDPDKIVVIHNAVTKKIQKMQAVEFRTGRKTVLFLGRMTMQKGPEYFLQAAKKALEVEPHINFLMVGTGDMFSRMIHFAHELGIERHILFAGFLAGNDIDKAFQSAHLFVMPSVSEPFGIAALEAIKHGVPVIISHNAGVSEVIPNMLKVDFWDTDEMANKIVMALRYKVLTDELTTLARRDLGKLSWHQQAEKIKDLYHALA